MSVFARSWLAPVLLVDDEPDDIALTRWLLKRALVENPVIAFTDSAEALAFLRELDGSPEAALLTPAMMFLDIKMPGVHGFVLLKWVRHQPRLDPMAIVMLSGSDEPEDHLRAEKLGADHYLVKFPNAARFAEIVQVGNDATRREARRHGRVAVSGALR